MTRSSKAPSHGPKALDRDLRSRSERLFQGSAEALGSPTAPSSKKVLAVRNLALRSQTQSASSTGTDSSPSSDTDQTFSPAGKGPSVLRRVQLSATPPSLSKENRKSPATSRAMSKEVKTSKSKEFCPGLGTSPPTHAWQKPKQIPTADLLPPKSLDCPPSRSPQPRVSLNGRRQQVQGDLLPALHRLDLLSLRPSPAPRPRLHFSTSRRKYTI